MAEGPALVSPQRDIAFPTLSEAEIDRLRGLGEVHSTSAGEVLFSEGDVGADVYVVLSGRVEVAEHSAGRERQVTVHEAGQFTGDVDMLTGRGALVTATVREAGEVLAVPLEEIREVVADVPDLGDRILNAFLMRRTLLLESGFAGLRIVGSRYSQETFRIKEFAARNHIPYTWFDLESDPAAEELLEKFDVPASDTPMVVCRDSRVLRNPTNTEVADCMGLDVRPPSEEVFDLVVVGAGPAGLAASVYGASEGLNTIAVDEDAPGGQASSTSKIENYLGFPAGISGDELTERALVQARKFGAEVLVPFRATALGREEGLYTVQLSSGDTVRGRTVLIATGAHYRKLDIPGLEELEGAGVYYAATEMEQRDCGGSTTVVVGGGNSAGQAAMFLASCGSRVHLMVRGEELGRNMSRYLVERLRREGNVAIHTRTEVTGLRGDGHLEGIVARDRDGDRTREIDAQGLFIFIGAEPHTRWLDGAVEMDDQGFIRTGPSVGYFREYQSGRDIAGRDPFLLETSTPGIFAAGDVRSESVKRVASAVAEGSISVKFVHQFLSQ